MCDFDFSLLMGYLGAFSSLIAAMITAGVALWIAKQWRQQKEGEIIAHEAKLFMYSMTKLESLQMEIEGYRTEGININELVGEYKIVQRRMSDQVNFLGFALSQDKVLDYLSQQYLSQCIVYTKHLEKFILGDEAFIRNKLPHPGDAYDLNVHLLRYATLKKTSK